MNTAVINIKTDPKVKKDAQNIASELGFSLSAILNGYLKNFVRTKAVHFNLEEPSQYLIDSIKESQEDIKAGRVVAFKNPDKAIEYLDKLIDEQRKNKRNRVFKKVSKTAKKSSFAYSS